MLSKCSELLFPIIQFIFNFILLRHVFPLKWVLTLIIAIFKNKGSRKNSKYYRPVSLVHMLSKLFDFVLLERFKLWFKPSDEQSAYQSGRSCADNIFLVRCLINLAKHTKKKLYIIAVDFDGAFDRISRVCLFKKLVRFGIGATYLACLMAVYSRTECIIFGANDYVYYDVDCGIKQGSPMSPYLFLFYVDDIFEYFQCIFGSACILEIVSVLMHADDTILLASSRELAIRKLQRLVSYCQLNSLLLEPSKSKFIVINGINTDFQSLPVGNGFVEQENDLLVLGSHLSATGNPQDDIRLQVKFRFDACIKLYNFIRSNRLAPVCVKLKVFKSCVLSNLLYNCEAFGKDIPKELENQYFKLLKAALDVRINTPNDLVLIECGMLPLKAFVRETV